MHIDSFYDVPTISVTLMGVQVSREYLHRHWIKDPLYHERKYIHFCNVMQTANNKIVQTNTICHLEDHQHHSTCLSLCYLHCWCCNYSLGYLRGNIWIRWDCQISRHQSLVQNNLLNFFHFRGHFSCLGPKKHHCTKVIRVMLLIVSTKCAWHPV